MIFFRFGSRRSFNLTLTAYASSAGFVAKIESQNQSEHEHSQIDQYPNLSIGHANRMSRCMNQKLYALLGERVTRFGFTIDDAIQPGVDDPSKPSDAHTGLIAGDEESYQLFRELFECVIRDHFDLEKGVKNVHQPVDINFSLVKIGENVAQNIIGFRVRACRNLSGHPFSAWITRAGRRLIERTLTDVFEKASRSFDKSRSRQIVYYSLVDLPDQYRVNPPYTAYWRGTGVNKDWPDARGALVMHSPNSSTVVSVNDRDHIRMWMNTLPETTGDALIKSLQLFFEDIQIIEDTLLAEYGFGFAWDDHFGYLTSNPSDVGTALKLEVDVYLPKLCKDPRFASILRSKCEQRLKIIRLDEDDGIVKLTNSQRIGVSEVEIIQALMNDLELLIRIEQNLTVQ